MRRLILGTAGHIDHGKTSLVRALTGVDTDRLPEEKRRGITIDLGFASMKIGEAEIGIVDVPGHEALVRNMLAGATGFDVVLFVIAADEGVMPQTREHLAIMHLLGVQAAVVALTKSDLVDDDWLELVQADIAALFADTDLRDAAVVPVSSVTGAGIDMLRGALTQAFAKAPERSRDGLFRMPIDRIFTVKGTGTVVTGTVWSGTVRRDAQLRVLPADRMVRARGLQVHSETRDSAGAGERVAIALATDRSTIERGDTLVLDAGWRAASMITARVHVLRDASAPLRNRQRIRFHVGTAEVLGRVAVLDGAEIAPGSTGWVQLRLEAPAVARAGDRFIIRSYSPVNTIAGGIVAEPHAPKRKHITPDIAERLSTIIEGGGQSAITAVLSLAGNAGVAAAELAVRVPGSPGCPAAGVRVADRCYAPEVVENTRTDVLSAIDAFHAQHPEAPGLPRAGLRMIAATRGDALVEHAVRALTGSGTVRVVEATLARNDFSPRIDPQRALAAAAVRDYIVNAGLAAPSVGDLPDPLRNRPDLPGILRGLEGEGLIISIDRDRYIDPTALDQLVQRLSGIFPRGQELTTTELKDAIGLSRKYVIPLLEWLDGEGITRRSGEVRTWQGRLGPVAGQIA